MIFHGAVISVDKNNGIYNYLVEKNGKIAYVGNELPDEYKGMEITELGEGALMPAFADTHGHFASYAMLAAAVKLNGADTNAEKLQMLKKADKETAKGRALFCFGASPYVKEGRFINAADIDAVVPDRAVVIISTDGHTVVLNKKALKKMPASIKTADGYSEDGVLGKECFFKVIDNMLRIISPLEGLKAFQSAFDEYSRRGFGLIAAECGIGLPLDLDIELLKWIYRGQDSGVQMRFFIQSFDVKKAVKRNIPRLGGCFETALDGSVTSSDAALGEPYAGTDNYGVLFYENEELYRKIKKIHDAGLNFQMHAIGDRAVMQAAETYKRILDESPRDDHRHGIIHATFVPDKAMDIIEKYKLQVQGQPAFIEMDSQYSDLLIEKLGEKRCYAAEPHDEFIRRGVNFSAGSDCPVTFPNGVGWVHWMVNNPNIKHRLALTDAIRVCTYNGYFATFDEKERGSLETGKTADMIILDKNPYDVQPQDILNIDVAATYYAGKRWTPGCKSIFSTIITGMCRRSIKL